MFDDDEMIGYNGEMVKVGDLTVDELNTVLDEYEDRERQGAATGHEAKHIADMMTELRATIAFRRAQGPGKHAQTVDLRDGTTQVFYRGQSGNPRHTQDAQINKALVMVSNGWYRAGDWTQKYLASVGGRHIVVDA